MIDGYETFTYIGYTEGEDNEESPTLYFEEGHYTQVHDEKDNVGWHPRKQYYRGANIKKSEHDRYGQLRKDGDEQGKNTFKSNFLNGDYDSSETTAKFFECYSNDNVNWLGHPSRSRLMKPSDSGFNSDYNAEYAKGILAKGKIADNEL